jgi:hypothetical protein
MPKRTDLQRILILGSEPIVIGQAAEFRLQRHSGVRAGRDVRSAFRHAEAPSDTRSPYVAFSAVLELASHNLMIAALTQVPGLRHDSSSQR